MKHNIHPINTTPCKVEPMCPDWGPGSKLMQHSSFPSKPLVTSAEPLMSYEDSKSSFSLLKNLSLLSWRPLRTGSPPRVRETSSLRPHLSNTYNTPEKLHVLYVVCLNFDLAYKQSPKENKGAIKPGKRRQCETYLVHNSQCVKAHSQDRILFITYKNASCQCKQHIYSKMQFSVLWNGRAFIIVKIVYVKNTCNMPLYIALLYSREGRN